MVFSAVPRFFPSFPSAPPIPSPLSSFLFCCITLFSVLTNEPQLPCCLPSPGDAGGAQRHRGAVRREDPEEGRGDPGWRRGMHHGGEESVGVVWEAPLPNTAPLHLPDHGRRPMHNTVALQIATISYCASTLVLISLFLCLNHDGCAINQWKYQNLWLKQPLLNLNVYSLQCIKQ